MNSLITKLKLIQLLMLVIMLSACKNEKDQQAHEHDEYTCPMHPQIVQEKPGTCPVCGMDLVKKSNNGDEMTITEDLKTLIKPTNLSVVASIQTTNPVKKTLSNNTTASGVIGYDTRKTYSIPVRFGGRIEKLYLKYNFQPVKEGQVIMEIYSPELVTAQRELLYVVQTQIEDKQLIESAKQKLILLGLTTRQIDNVIIAGKETFAFPILSPYTGYIVESTTTLELPPSGMEQPSNDNGSMGKKSRGGMQTPTQMNIPSLAPVSGQQISIREGMYVTTGQNLFKVVDDSRLWAEIYFSANEGKAIRKGDSIKLQVKGLNDTISSRIDFIQPFFSEGKQFLQIRSYLNDLSKNLRVGQLVTVRVSRSLPQTLWVPKLAVLNLGVQQIVFIKTAGTFKPLKVKIGVESGNWVEIIDGLDESDAIAVNAQYLVDSESFIKVMNP